MNVYDESLLLDNPEYNFLKPMRKKLRNYGEALPLLNVRYVDWTTVFTTAACSLRFDWLGPPVLYQLRHGGAAHEVFTAIRDVTVCRKSATGAASVGHVGTRTLLASHKSS